MERRARYHQGGAFICAVLWRALADTTNAQPDITFFGQALDSEFDECLFRDREQVDLLVIMGTSLKVAPVSEVLCEWWCKVTFAPAS